MCIRNKVRPHLYLLIYNFNVKRSSRKINITYEEESGDRKFFVLLYIKRTQLRQDSEDCDDLINVKNFLFSIRLSIVDFRINSLFFPVRNPF